MTASTEQSEQSENPENPENTEYFENWVSTFRRAPSAAVRLVCLPHAGGSASFFFPLAKAFSPDVEVMAVQYPGRQARRNEPGIDNVPEYADRIFAALRRLTDRPLALFGHSMGAVLAYEVALRMRKAGLPAPVRLFASGRRAPSRYRDEQVHKGTDGQLVAELRGLGGPHQSVLTDPEVLALILPAVRGDYRAVERYRHDPQARLECPVTVLVGDEDPRVTLDEARAWEEHTTGPTELEVFRGGHFYLVDRAGEVIDVLTRRLSAQ
ncbi:thioesterase II family protein [Streptomyces olivaceus]|uniref:thioesterase II family protein n=1 Tax=Streptomyces olivaceus TaxID=47716 RepID=UPI00380C627B